MRSHATTYARPCSVSFRSTGSPRRLLIYALVQRRDRLIVFSIERCSARTRSYVLLRVDTARSRSPIDHSVAHASRSEPIYPTRKNHSAGQFACRRVSQQQMDLATESPHLAFRFSAARASERASGADRDRRCHARAWAASSRVASRGVIKIRLIYGSRNTNVEHYSDYQWLNCRPFGPRTSHYAAHRNKSATEQSATIL